MVDFRKHLDKPKLEKYTDPLEIYKRLDRASDKGPLRPVQERVLVKWHNELRESKDIILKLHTGQGKTLVGLLILQSKLNEKEGQALYLCPNKFLVDQTINQAEQFGIKCVTAAGDLPNEFYDGEAILVTTIQKLFNGKSKFKFGPKSEKVSYLLMDDSHACIDIIKEQHTIKIIKDKHKDLYEQIFSIFEEDIKEQGAGTLEDIKAGSYQDLLPVPYWVWLEKHDHIESLLAKNQSFSEIGFVWPLLRNMLKHCLCIISSNSIEISPYLTPLEQFGSYSKADHRIFMSATVTDDSFLVKDLGISKAVIQNPLTDEAEKWVGEKMILIPSEFSEILNRVEIVNHFAKQDNKRPYGVVALSPSFSKTKDWEMYGAIIANKAGGKNIEDSIKDLKRGTLANTLVIVNRYDGIDLPDKSCRILILDSKPYSARLLDRYTESCREESEAISIKNARIIEQGLGRSVRGEKDFSVIILIGSNLIKSIRSKNSRKYFSDQTQKHLEIGITIAKGASKEIVDGIDPLTIMDDLIKQCLDRDDDWKEFYIQEMDNLTPKPIDNTILDIFELELEAEKYFIQEDAYNAQQTIQKIMDDYSLPVSEKGWYLQEIGRYLYEHSKQESNNLQIEAHKKNSYLLKPKSGMIFTKLETLEENRLSNIVTWVQKFDNFDNLRLSIENSLNNLKFGTNAKEFEKALGDIGIALGFKSERPDKKWKEGPDNLWALSVNKYLVIECKNEVRLDRDAITKTESGQMNNSIAWFERNYNGASSKNIMIIPTVQLGKGAGFNRSVEIMNNRKLKKLNSNIRNFFFEFSNKNFESLDLTEIQSLLSTHELTIDDVFNKYTVNSKQR